VKQDFRRTCRQMARIGLIIIIIIIIILQGSKRQLGNFVLSAGGAHRSDSLGIRFTRVGIFVKVCQM
jgi:hypothetical protein